MESKSKNIPISIWIGAGSTIAIGLFGWVIDSVNSSTKSIEEVKETVNQIRTTLVVFEQMNNRDKEEDDEVKERVKMIELDIKEIQIILGHPR